MSNTNTHTMNNATKLERIYNAIETILELESELSDRGRITEAEALGAAAVYLVALKHENFNKEAS